MNSLKSLFSNSSPASLSEEQTNLYIEAWKKSIDVQQHFNDLSWRIRALWLTALTFTLGATFLAYKDSDELAPLAFLGGTSPAVLIPILGILLWFAFWFVDAAWYHRLLNGAVAEGIRLEETLTRAGYEIRLTHAIGEKSPVSTALGIMHSKHKLNVFYLLAGLPLLVSIIFFIVS